MARLPKRKSATAQNSAPAYTFLTNHSHVLICLAQNPEMTLREVALRVGITERAVIAIVHDLADTKVLTVSRQGRRNVYRIHQQAHLRHPVEQHKTVGDLIRAILDWAGSPVRN